MEAGEISSDEEVIILSPNPERASETDELQLLNIQPPPPSRKHKHRHKDSKKHQDKVGRPHRDDARWQKSHSSTKLNDLERERHRIEREHRHEERRLQRQRYDRQHRPERQQQQQQQQQHEHQHQQHEPHQHQPQHQPQHQAQPRRQRSARRREEEHQRSTHDRHERRPAESKDLEIKRRKLDRDNTKRSHERMKLNEKIEHERKKEELRNAKEIDVIFGTVKEDDDDLEDISDDASSFSDEDHDKVGQLTNIAGRAYDEVEEKKEEILPLYSDEELLTKASPVTSALYQAKSKFDDSESEEELRRQEDQYRLEEEEEREKIPEQAQRNERLVTDILSDDSKGTDLDDSQSEESQEEDDKSPVPSPVPVKLPAYFPAIQGCRSVEEFNCLNRIEEGTYGVVYRAKDKKTNEIVALKRLKMEKEKEGFPITSLREINTLLKAQHVNIVHVREIVVGSNMDKIFIVMDYVEHDMKCLMESMKEPFMIGEVKTLMIQLLRGVAHMHDNWIIHRDLKTSNLLLSHKGILKIGDFGLAREYGAPLRHYTPIVVTLWYRAPELLLGTKLYSTAIDLWSVGAIFSEFLTRKPLFPAKTDMDALHRIFKELGTPTDEIWNGVSELPGMKKCTFPDHPYNQLKNRFGSILSSTGFNLINAFLTYDPEKRITAEEALKNPYFREAPHPIDSSMFPTWPAKSENGNKPKKDPTPKPPSGGQAYSKLMAEEYDGFSLNKTVASVSSKGGGFALKF